LHKESGELIWESKKFFGEHPPPLYSRKGEKTIIGHQPPLLDTADTMIVFMSLDAIRKHNIRTGEVLWESPESPRIGLFRKVDAPGVAQGYPPMVLGREGDRFYAAFQKTVMASTQEILLQPRDSHQLVLINPKTGVEEWKWFKKDWYSTSNFVVHNFQVFMAVEKKLYAVDLWGGKRQLVSKLKFAKGDVPARLEIRPNGFLVSGHQDLAFFSFDGTRQFHTEFEVPFQHPGRAGGVFLDIGLAFGFPVAAGSGGILKDFLVDWDKGKEITRNREEFVYFFTMIDLENQIKSFGWNSEKFIVPVSEEKKKLPGLVKVRKKDGLVVGRILLGTESPELKVSSGENWVIFQSDPHTILSFKQGREEELDQESLQLQKEGKFREAVDASEQALQTRLKELGINHPQVAVNYLNLGHLYRETGDFEKAENAYKMAISIQEISGGSESLEVAVIINHLARLYLDKANFEAAETLCERAGSIFQKEVGINHLLYGMNRLNLGLVLQSQGRYARAGEVYQEGLAIIEGAAGPESEEMAMALSHIGDLSLQRGRYREGWKAFQEAQSIWEDIFGADHPNVASCKAGKAQILHILGKYPEAESLASDALQTRIMAWGENHPAVGDSLMTQALLFQDQGRTAEAEKNYKQTLAIYEEVYGPNHPKLARCLNQLAELYIHEEQFAQAEGVAERAVSIDLATLGPEHPFLAVSYDHLAIIYGRLEKFDDAEALFLRSLEIKKKVFGPEHPEMAVTYLGLAEIQADGWRKENTPGELGEKINQALKILEQTTVRPDVEMKAHLIQARRKFLDGDLEGAISHQAEALELVENLRPRVGRGETGSVLLFEKYNEEFDRMVDWQLEKGNFEVALQFVEKARARIFQDQMAASSVNWKIRIPHEVVEDLEKREEDLRARMAEYRRRLSMLYVRKDLSAEDRRGKTRDLVQKLDKAQMEYQLIFEEIKEANPVWHRLLTSARKSIPLGTFQNEVVPQNGLLLVYQLGTEKSHLFVIRHSGEESEVFPLVIPEYAGEVFGLGTDPLTSKNVNKMILGDSTTEGVISRLGNPDQVSAPDLNEELHALWNILIPSPLWIELLSKSEVIIVPDGSLHSFPFDSMVVQNVSEGVDQKYWLDEGPAIRYANSITSLYNLEKRAGKRAQSSGGEAVIVSLSDPVFDIGRVIQAYSRQVGEEADLSQFQVGGQTEFPISDFARGAYVLAGGNLSPLPRSADESKKIRAAFESHLGPGQIIHLEKINATEGQLRRNIQGKRYLHLATHGLVEQQGHHLFAALALTPSPMKVPTPEDDGFLQLFEIYDLDLQGCELAVLSACRTNVGRQIEGEGVFGLSRGFLVAGVNRVVATQWSISDDSAAELVAEFFRQIASREGSGQRIEYAVTLRDAKRVVRSRKKWSSPYHWAPFILMGSR
jgi:CHAT domain-containing protein/tetratricopeptide (TPR) repeat protein